MKEEMNGRKSEKVFWGVFLILAAAFLVVSQLGFLEGVGVVRILFTIFWAAVLVQGVFSRSFGKILFSIACICIIYDKQLGIEAITPVTVLVAALFGTIGLNMIFRRKKHYYHKSIWKGEALEKETIIDIEGLEEEDSAEKETSGGTKIYFNAKFGAAEKYVNTECFEYAILECSFGGMKVFFDNARIPGGKAVIELDVSFGGVELYIPREWNVVDHTDTQFGGVEEKNRCRTSGSPVVTLTGNINFSGVTIIYI